MQRENQERGGLPEKIPRRHHLLPNEAADKKISDTKKKVENTRTDCHGFPFRFQFFMQIDNIVRIGNHFFFSFSAILRQ